MVKILILANHDIGLYNFRAELLQRLIDEGYSVHFSVPSGKRVPLIEAMGAVYHKTRINRRGKNPFQDMALLACYLKLIIHLRPAAVLTYTAKPNTYGGIACRLTRVPHLANITGLGSELHRKGYMARIMGWLYRVSLRTTRVIFFQNNSDLEYFIDQKIINQNISLNNSPKLHVLPGSGVNLERFTPDPAKQFSDTGMARFLFIGRIMKDKGIAEFLEAVEVIKSRYPSTQFEILGFYESEAFKFQIESMQNQGLIQSVILSEDIRRQLKTTDCVVLPSHHEGMSNVILEAASSGVPVITTDIPGCREAIINGETGYLCVARNAGHLAEQMERFINLDSDSKRALGRGGRVLMEERFNRKIVIDAYLRELTSLVGNEQA